MKICETLLTLGEVSVENETYDQAVTDITECLNKRKVMQSIDFYITLYKDYLLFASLWKTPRASYIFMIFF